MAEDGDGHGLAHALGGEVDEGVVGQVGRLVALALHLDQPLQRDRGIARDEEHRVEVQDAAVGPVCQRKIQSAIAQMKKSETLI